MLFSSSVDERIFIALINKRLSLVLLYYSKGLNEFEIFLLQSIPLIEKPKEIRLCLAWQVKFFMKFRQNKHKQNNISFTRWFLNYSKKKNLSWEMYTGLVAQDILF